MTKTQKAAAWTLFVLYVIAMMYLLFRPWKFGNGFDSPQTYWTIFHANYNFRPFYTIRGYAYVLANGTESYRHAAIVNLFGNVGTFIPLGVFLPLLFKRYRNLFMTTGVSVVIICAIELLQLFTLTGVCDVDDLILNMTGVLIGYIAYRIVSLAKG